MTTVEHTFDQYIGWPYQRNGRDENGIDCWGLVRRIYSDMMEVELDAYVLTENLPQLWDCVHDQIAAGRWLSISAQLGRGQHPAPMDVVLANVAKKPHVGVYIGRGKFINAREPMGVCVERINSPEWAQRIEAYYRYTF